MDNAINISITEHKNQRFLTALTASRVSRSRYDKLDVISAKHMISQL